MFSVFLISIVQHCQTVDLAANLLYRAI